MPGAALPIDRPLSFPSSHGGVAFDAVPPAVRRGTNSRSTRRRQLLDVDSLLRAARGTRRQGDARDAHVHCTISWSRRDFDDLDEASTSTVSSLPSTKPGRGRVYAGGRRRCGPQPPGRWHEKRNAAARRRTGSSEALPRRGGAGDGMRADAFLGSVARAGARGSTSAQRCARAWWLAQDLRASICSG